MRNTGLLLFLLGALGACSSKQDGGAPPQDDGGIPDTGSADASDPNGPWTFEPVKLDGVTPLWGGYTTEQSPTTVFLVGGVEGASGPVVGRLSRFDQTPDGMKTTLVSSKLAPRFCNCAMVDTKRNEVVNLGGRDDNFMGTETAEIVNLATGDTTPLDAGDAVKHPVGCHAVFLEDRDEGYVFGGLSETSGFGGQIFRYTPADRKFTALTATGPEARYDAAFRYPVHGGPIWLVSGMGRGSTNVKFFSDIWKFDPATATWTEVKANGATPKGRRTPWVTFAPDASAFIMGYGSDSGQGTSFLSDIWRFDVASATWTSVPVAAAPPARGFATWLPGPPGSAGLMSGGLLKSGAATQAVVVRPPVSYAGWR